MNNNEEKSSAGKLPDDNGLVTERDIDEESGLFQEGSFPGALPDSDQQAAVNHAIPKEE